MPDDDSITEVSIEEASGRVGWFASGFFVAAMLIGLLLFTDGYFDSIGPAALADVPDTIIEGK